MKKTQSTSNKQNITLSKPSKVSPIGGDLEGASSKTSPPGGGLEGAGYELSDKVLYGSNVFITPGGIFGSVSSVGENRKEIKYLNNF